MTRAAIAFAFKTISVFVAVGAGVLHANEARAQAFYPAFCKIWNGVQGFSEDSNPLTAAMPFFRANCSNVGGASCTPDPAFPNEQPPAHFSCIAPNCDGNGHQFGTWSTGQPSFPPQQPIPGATCGIAAQSDTGNPNKNNGGCGGGIGGSGGAGGGAGGGGGGGGGGGDGGGGGCPTSAGNPVNFANGNKFQQEVDYAKTGDALEFYRFYNSQGFFNYVPLGLGWTHTWNRYIITGVNTGEADAYRPDGKAYRFLLSGSQWVGDADNPETLVQTLDGGWRLTLRTDEVEVYDHLGRLQSVTSREGRTTTLSYSDGTATPPNGGTYENTNTPMTGGLLLRVTDFQGRSLQFRYSDSLSMSAMIDPTGAVYRYTFNVFDSSIENENLAGVQYPDGNARTYQYGEDGLIFNPLNGAVYSPTPQKLYWTLTGITDNGVRFGTYTYWNTGKARSTEHAGGVERYSFSADTQGTSTFTDPLGSVRTTGNSTILDVVQTNSITQNCPGCGGQSTMSFTYDANRNPTSTIDWNGNLTCRTFDTNRNLEISRTEGLRSTGTCASPVTTTATRTVTTEWNPSYRFLNRTAEPLRITSFSHNGDPGVSCAPAGASTALVCSKTIQATLDASGIQGFAATADGPARVWSYTYNVLGQVLSVDGPRTDVADITTYAYYSGDDPGGQYKAYDLASVTNAAGQTTQFTQYDGAGRLKQSIDPNLLVTTLDYWPRGWLKSRLITNGTISELTHYDYDAMGNLKKITRPDGSWVNFDYDGAYRLIGVDDSQGNSIDYVLDNMGNRTEEDTYDPSAVLRRQVKREFDVLSRLSKTTIVTDGAQTTFGYDSNGNLASTTYPPSLSRAATAYLYDALNRLKQVTDSSSGITQYGYDGLSQVIQVTDPNTHSTTYSINGLGNTLSLLSPDTGTTTYSAYDPAGNLQTAVDARGKSVNYVYDALNRVSTATYADQTITYAYDQGTYGKGHLTHITDATSQTAFTYDAVGRLKSDQRTIDGLVGTVSYDYDAYGRLSALTYPSGRKVTYGFDALGRISSITLAAGASVIPLLSNATYQPFGGIAGYTFGSGSGTYTRSYDLDGRVSGYTLGSATFNVTYDDANNVTKISKVGDSSADRQAAYDGLDRLLKFGNSLTSPDQAFTYDPTGNRTSKTQSSVTTTYVVSPTSNRLNSVGAVAFGYDNAGNETSDGSITFTYDNRGRMSGAGTATFAVNAMGQRMKKVVGTTTTYFDYDKDGHLLGEYDGSGFPIRETIWLGDTPVVLLAAQTRQAGVNDDIDGDAIADIALHNTTTGEVVTLLLNDDNSVKQQVSLGAAPTVFDMVGLADFNGDGNLDLVWKNSTTGDTWVWFYNGTQYVSASYLQTSDPAWKVVDLVDLNGDGHTDIILRNRTTGDTYAWIFNGSTFLSSAFLFNVDPAWNILGFKDLNGDGNIDIVLYYPPQQIAYVAYGPSFTNLQPFFAIGDTSYQPTRIADYNRDGRFDVVVRNTPTGYAFAWYFADRTFLGGAGLFGADMVWQQGPALEPYQKAAQGGQVSTAVSKPIPPGFIAPQPVAFPANALAPVLRRSPLGTGPVPSTTGPVAPGPPTPPGGKSLLKSLGSNNFAIYEIHSDHLNTPRMITRPSDRNPVWKWDNVDPFGANAPDENPGGVGTFTFNLRFPGQYFDAETASHYNFLRDAYDPSIGRYTQSDPIGLLGGLNTYSYVNDNPLRTVDLLGLARRDPPPLGPGCGPGHGQGIPDNPLIVVRFGKCCADHDNCYDDCKKKPSKAQCDQAFISCLRKECNSVGQFCHWIANLYISFGTASPDSEVAFNDSRKKCGPQGCH